MSEAGTEPVSCFGCIRFITGQQEDFRTVSCYRRVQKLAGRANFDFCMEDEAMAGNRENLLDFHYKFH